MSMFLTLVLLTSPVSGEAAKPKKNDVICTEEVRPNSRFTERVCVSKALAAKRSRNAEEAMRGLQNATGTVPNDAGPSGP